LVKAGLGLALLLAVAVAAAPYFINWNSLKDKATDWLSHTLHHKVTIESVSVSLFTGVTLNKVTVGNAQGFGSQPLFYNERAVLRPSLLSLFSGRIVINEIEFKNPAVFVVKNGRGVFNFSDMSAPSQAAPAAEGKKGSSSAPNVIVASFKISGGDLTYKDEQAGKTTAIKGLDLMLAGFSLKAGGHSRLELKFEADVEGKKIPLELVSNFSVDLDGQKLHLASFDLKAPSLKLSASGDVADFKGDPKLDVAAAFEAKLDTLVADLVPPSALKGMPEGLKISGMLSLKTNIKGRVSQLQNFDMKAELGFNKVGIKYGDVPAIEDMNGTFSLGPTRASLPALTFKMGGSPVTIALELSDYTVKGLMGPAESRRVSVAYKVSSPKLMLEPLIDYASIPDTPAELQAKAEEKAQTGGMKDYRSKVGKGVTVNGSIKVDAMQYKEITTGALVHQLELKNQRLKSTLDLKLFDGTLCNQLEADLAVKGPKHTFRVVLSKMQFEKAVNAAAASFPKNQALAQLKGKVLGSLSFDFKGTGLGSKPPALDKNMVLDGNFGMKDGVIKKLELQEKLAAAIPHPATQEVLRKDIPFGQMGGHIAMKNDKVTLSDFYLSSGADHRGGEILVQANGTQVLGGALDYHITPHFNPRVVKLEGYAADGFNDERGWATYNTIDYKGPDSKSAKADYLAGAKNAAKKIVDKHIDEVKQKAQDEGKKAVEEKGKDLIKQLPGNLKGLFGQ